MDELKNESNSPSKREQSRSLTSLKLAFLSSNFAYNSICHSSRDFENNFLKSRTSQCFISLSISLGALFIKFMSSKKEPRKFEFKNAAQIN